jgi:GxxExxY protein
MPSCYPLAPPASLSHAEVRRGNGEARRGSMTHNEISFAVIGAAIRIHRKLGTGLLESAYHDLLLRDLRDQGFYVESKKRVGFVFEGTWIENGLTTDLIIERRLIVEIKVVDALKRNPPPTIINLFKTIKFRTRVIDQLWRTGSVQRRAPGR